MNKYHYEIASLERCDAMSMFFAALTLVSGVFICGVSIDEEVQGFKLNLWTHSAFGGTHTQPVLKRFSDNPSGKEGNPYEFANKVKHLIHLD